MRAIIICLLLALALFTLPGCHDELAQAETWEDNQVASYVGSGVSLEEEVEPIKEAPVRYRYVQKCNGNSCEWVQEPIPDSISTPQAAVVRSYSSSSFRSAPLRAIGSRVRSLFSRIRSLVPKGTRFGRGC